MYGISWAKEWHLIAERTASEIRTDAISCELTKTLSIQGVPNVINPDHICLVMITVCRKILCFGHLIQFFLKRLQGNLVVEHEIDLLQMRFGSQI